MSDCSTWSGAVVCCDAAEARLMRQTGRLCITSTKLRSQLDRMFMHGGNDALPVAIDAVNRLGGISSADNPENWSLWEQLEQAGVNYKPLLLALLALAIIESPFKDPENVKTLGPGSLWCCRGTTVIVARNTSELVRVADTYATNDCYRPHGRMDEPFIPQPGGVCLISVDELRLLRIEGVKDLEIIFTYELEDTTGPGVAPPTLNWPTSLRALCAERPGLRVGVAAALVAPRYGEPFFLGLTRGLGYESDATTNPYCRAARRFAVETNIRTLAVSYRVVIWAGGDDVRELVRYGGLSIFTDAASGKRRKVQLRSLGLIRSDILAGAAVYDMTANRATLEAWAARRDFQRRRVSNRDHDRQRVRCKALPESHQGDIKENTVPLMGFRSRSEALRVGAYKLRNLQILEASEDGGVTTVPLKNLREGGVYQVNARPRTNRHSGEIELEQKRCKTRSPRWVAADAPGLLEWLKKSPVVIIAGLEPSGWVYAVIKVANGTEDQQREAVSRWCEDVGKRFPRTVGAQSWIEGSVEPGSDVRVGMIYHTNWRALSLETACYERYQTQGDYGTPLKTGRMGGATALERARAYADKVPLADVGTRNQSLHGAAWNIGDKFGIDALNQLAPLLLARSTLPEKEKRTIINRAITSTESKGQRA